jgi:hypothetical protein
MAATKTKSGGGRSSTSRPNGSRAGAGRAKGPALVGATTKALGKTALEVGKAGYRIGELAAEFRRVHEQASQKT